PRRHSVAMTRLGHAGALAAVLLIAAQPPASAARDYYVAPSGTARNAGTLESPWDLRTALSGGRGRVQPGDTIHLLGGTYNGHFVVDVSGRSGAPVTFKALADASPRIDGNLTTTTTSIVKAGQRDDRVTVPLAAVDDIRAGTQLSLGGGSGHDQLLLVESVSGLRVTGRRRCISGASCDELPSGSDAWVIAAVVDVPPTVHDVWFQGLEITDSGTDSRRWATSSDD